MKTTTITTVAELRNALASEVSAGHRIGFVPTMGFLHDGHASLMRAAATENDVVVASIFVNPLQFAPEEDLEDYPTDLAADSALAAESGVSILFVPPVTEMYPFGTPLTTVAVSQLARRYEGATRPEHFAGVATVVAKLFNIVGPCHSYFGEKDFQQLAIIKRMVTDLSMPVTVVGCPIVRESDGLAMSSRNIYLTPPERQAATVLRKALDAGVAAIEAGERGRNAVEVEMLKVFDAEPLAEVDYVAVVDQSSFQAPSTLTNDVRLLVAAQVGRPRLLDNCGVTIG